MKARTSKRAQRTPTAVAERRVKFVEHYLSNGHNALEAARAAGYTGKDASLRVQGSQMLIIPEVAELIEQRSRKVAEVARMSTDNWARELTALAFSRVGELYDAEGALIPIHKLPDHVQAAIASVDVGTGLAKFADKNRALETMAKHLGLFERDNAQRGENVRVIVQLVG